MTIYKETKNTSVTLRLEGRLDTTTAPMLEAEISKLPADTGELVLDMHTVEYISSAGLRVLLGAQKKMTPSGSMKLIHVCETVMEVLEMTGFADILTIE